MRIVWDESKRKANLAKHKLDFSDLDEAYFANAVIRPARPPRWFAFGLFEGVALAVVFSPLGSEAISVISMRPARWDERRQYEQAKGF
jgi:uncharacterized DUF497 family protein